MHFNELQLSNFRNFSSLKLQLTPHVNFFYGANASGKTSILEALFLLGRGRSFRSTRLNNLITHDEASLAAITKFTLANGLSFNFGLAKQRTSKNLQAQLNGNKPASLVEISTLLPLQLINPDVFLLLDGSPAERRKFIDWGVFYFAPDFFAFWQRYVKALKQRNSLLKSRSFSKLEMEAWEAELATTGSQLTKQRQTYCDLLQPVFQKYLQEFLPNLDISLVFYPGWNTELELAEFFASNREKDLQQGFTLGGPQRADLRIYTSSFLAKEALSRGQQKLVVSALKLSQAEIMHTELAKECIFLVDDLAAELDAQHQEKFCSLLTKINSQILVTSLDKRLAKYFSTSDLQMFHVKQNQLIPANS